MHVTVSAVTRTPSPHTSMVGLLLSNYGHWFSLSSQHTSVWQLAFVSGLTGLLTAALCGHAICSKIWPISLALPAPVTSRCTLWLFETSIIAAAGRARPVWVFIHHPNHTEYSLILQPDYYRTNFLKIPTEVFIHPQNVDPTCSLPITLNDNTCWMNKPFKKELHLQLLTSSFSGFTQNALLTSVWQPKAIIHICTVCNAAFMNWNSFLFHQAAAFETDSEFPGKRVWVKAQHRNILFVLTLVATSCITGVMQTGWPFLINAVTSWLHIVLPACPTSHTSPGYPTSLCTEPPTLAVSTNWAILRTPKQAARKYLAIKKLSLKHKDMFSLL